MPREHDKEYFYKYMTADAAEKVLKTGKFLYSAPSLFNDPFDNQTSFRFTFTEEEVARKFYEIIEKFVFGDEEPKIVTQKPLGKVLQQIRGQRVQGQKKEELMKTIKESADTLLGSFSQYESNFNGAIIDFLAHSRILCVSEIHENVVMWSHYSEKHSGAVIKLNCVDAADDNLLIARPIIYTKEFPNFLPVDEWVSGILGLVNNDYSTMAFDAAYIKHEDWGYEREWRVYVPLMPTEEKGDGRSLWYKDPRVFGALYLGCRMPAEKQKKLIEVAMLKYPHMEIHKALKSKSSFSLEFVRIK